MKAISQNWDLDSLFFGGSASESFSSYLILLREKIQDLQTNAKDNEGKTDPQDWVYLINLFQEVHVRLRQASAFVSCLTAQNVQDQQAQKLGAEVRQLRADLGSIANYIEEQALQISDAEWEKILAHAELAPIAFSLDEMRKQARERMSAEKEVLVNALSVDGYHAWSELYNSKIVARMSIPMEIDGEVREMSVGQVANLFAHADREIRKQAYTKFEAAWAEEAELCAAALNHLAGFRLNVYKARGWDSVLKEPLMINRMSKETLDAMWSAVEGSKERLKDYFQCKAELLGLDGLEWYDVGAPIAKSSRTYSFEEAAQFVIDQFGQFSPDMAALAERALTERWVEAEDRPGKRPGAFCTSFPESKESRIFMTFSGSADNLFTLAHELGHAYHGSVLRDMPPMSQRYAMNVAETASTFAELVVADAAIRAALTDEERLALLDSKIEQSAAMFMNIHARFLFETRFYEMRKKGVLSVDELNLLMEEAQREAYAEGLKSYHPHFWASKLHFYITGVPFYNFPYTFGYLLSQGLYARAQDEGPGFAEKYADLLRDTGRMTVEELVKTHLGEDLTKPEFWEKAVQNSLKDIDDFLELARK